MVQKRSSSSAVTQKSPFSVHKKKKEASPLRKKQNSKIEVRSSFTDIKSTRKGTNGVHDKRIPSVLADNSSLLLQRKNKERLEHEKEEMRKEIYAVNRIMRVIEEAKWKRLNHINTSQNFAV